MGRMVNKVAYTISIKLSIGPLVVQSTTDIAVVRVVTCACFMPRHTCTQRAPPMHRRYRQSTSAAESPPAPLLLFFIIGSSIPQHFLLASFHFIHPLVSHTSITSTSVLLFSSSPILCIPSFRASITHK